MKLPDMRPAVLYVAFAREGARAVKAGTAIKAMANRADLDRWLKERFGRAEYEVRTYRREG
jgi:hypothetical protein